MWLDVVRWWRLWRAGAMPKPNPQAVDDLLRLHGFQIVSRPSTGQNVWRRMERGKWRERLEADAIEVVKQERR